MGKIIVLFIIACGMSLAQYSPPIGNTGGVTTFNTRTGAVTLTSGDVTTALGYTPSGAAIADQRILGNFTGGSAAPQAYSLAGAGIVAGAGNCGTANQIPVVTSAGIVTCFPTLTYTSGFLQNTGTAQFINNAGFIASGIASIGAAGPQPASMLYIQTAVQNLTSGGMTGVVINPINTPTSASTATDFGLTTNTQWKGSANSPSGQNYGVNTQATFSGTGSLGPQWGGEFQSLATSTGALTNSYGGQFYASNQGNGTVTNQYAGLFGSNTSGTSTTTNDYGNYISNPSGGGTVTNRTQLYIENPTVGVTNWSIFSAGGTNYLRGKLLIGNSGGCAGRAVNCFEYDDGLTASPLLPYALQSNLIDSSANNGYAFYANATDTHTIGTRSQLSGILGDATAQNGSGATTFLIGAEGRATNNGANLSVMTGFTGAVNITAGTTVDAHAADTNGVVITGGAVTNAASSFVSRNSLSGGGTLTNNYGLYVQDQSSVGTNNWNIYSAGTGLNYFGGPISAASYATATNCANAASPAACGSAAAGAVAIPTGVTSVALVVNTTAVTANSRITLTSDDSLTIAATTCNSTLATLVGGLAVTARTDGTSFTITYNGTIATNPLCVSYTIEN